VKHEGTCSNTGAFHHEEREGVRVQRLIPLSSLWGVAANPIHYTPRCDTAITQRPVFMHCILFSAQMNYSAASGRRIKKLSEKDAPRGGESTPTGD